MPKVIPLNPEPAYVCNLSLTEKEAKYLRSALGGMNGRTCKELLANSMAQFNRVDQEEGWKILLDNEDSIYNQLDNFLDGEVDE